MTGLDVPAGPLQPSPNTTIKNTRELATARKARWAAEQLLIDDIEEKFTDLEKAKAEWKERDDPTDDTPEPSMSVENITALKLRIMQLKKDGDDASIAAADVYLGMIRALEPPSSPTPEPPKRLSPPPPPPPAQIIVSPTIRTSALPPVGVLQPSTDRGSGDDEPQVPREYLSNIRIHRNVPLAALTRDALKHVNKLSAIPHKKISFMAEDFNAHSLQVPNFDHYTTASLTPETLRYAIKRWIQLQVSCHGERDPGHVEAWTT